MSRDGALTSWKPPDEGELMAELFGDDQDDANDGNVGNVAWVRNLKSRYWNFDFEFAEGQNIKISPKYKNAHEAQNIKIMAVSKPILTRISPFFSIFQDLSEKMKENC